MCVPLSALVRYLGLADFLLIIYMTVTAQNPPKPRNACFEILGPFNAATCVNNLQICASISSAAMLFESAFLLKLKIIER